MKKVTNKVEKSSENELLSEYATMQGVEGATGMPLAMQSAYKRAGCSAFGHNRVKLAPLLRWHFQHTGAGDIIEEAVNFEREQALHEKAKRIRVETENRVTDGELIPFEDARRVMIEASQPIANAIDSLPDYGSRVNPGDPELGTAALREISREIKAQIRTEIPKAVKA